jgi:hypothetical protein
MQAITVQRLVLAAVTTTAATVLQNVHEFNIELSLLRKTSFRVAPTHRTTLALPLRTTLTLQLRSILTLQLRTA